MKLLLFTESFPNGRDLIFSGGVQSYIYYLSKELSNRHQVTIISQRYKNAPAYEQISRNLIVYRVGMPLNSIEASLFTLPYRLIFLLSAFKKGLEIDFDVVQGNNFVTYPVAFLVGFFKRKKTVAWYPDVFVGRWFNLMGAVGLIGEISERFSLILPWNSVIALSNSTKNKLTKFIKKPIPVIYGGVNINDFQINGVSKNEVFTIICVARLVNYKRVDLLIDAANILKTKGYNFKIDLIGDGPEKKKIETLIDNYNLGERMNLSSGISRTELIKKYRQAHIFCLPSEVEGFGLVIIEAAACKLPYVVTNIDILKEVTKGKGGLYFKKGDARDLASKFEVLINNKDLRKSLSRESIELARSYSWKEIAKQFERVYEGVLRKKVVMLIDAWFPHIGGGQIHTWELSKELYKKGIDVKIITRDLGRWINDFPEIEVIRLGSQRKFDSIYGRLEYLVWATLKCLKEEYDILHGHAFSPGLILPIVKFFKRKPIVYTVHGKGVKIAGFGIGSSFLESLVTYKIPYNLEITVAQSTIAKNVNAKRLVVIPNGVKVNEFVNAQRKRKGIRDLIYVGRLSNEKGLDILIKSLKIIKDRNLKLTVIGDGDEKQNLIRIAKDMRVIFKGKKEGKELIKELRGADLLVLPSRTEGLPLTLFEAWTAKLPILVTNVGDIPRYLKDEVNGFLTKPDIEVMAKDLKRAISFKKLNRLTDNGYKMVQKYSWENTAQQTIKEYEKLNS